MYGTEVNVRAKLEPLKPLDLSKCRTVSDIVRRMARCSFGARMLGEVANTLTEWARMTPKPVIVYDGNPREPLAGLLRDLVHAGWFSGLVTSEEYVSLKGPPAGGNVLVVGHYTERFEDELCAKAGRTIFVNADGQARPGQVRDGHFPDVVFSDPRFVLPVLAAVLGERLRGIPTTAEELVVSLPRYGGLAHEIAHGTETLYRMISDPDCMACMTVSGAMTVAQMDLLICDLLDRGFVKRLLTTGALMAHGLVKSTGLRHYKYNPLHSDYVLAEEKINRVTDTLEPEENFDHIEVALKEVFAGFDGGASITPTILHRAIGKYLVERYPGKRGILKSAYERNVPVSVPAFVDSEVANDLYVENQRRIQDGKPRIVMDLERDSELLVEAATSAKRLGIFSIGGGVPRNHAQNVAPLIEILNARLGLDRPESKFFYGCRIDPTPLHYGNLSGCTYSEGGSWRKMDLVHGRFSEIRADATIIWPILQAAVFNRMGRELEYANDQLEGTYAARDLAAA